MYWLYTIPNWLFEVLTVSAFVGFSMVGIFSTRKLVRRIHIQRSHNDIVGFFLAGLTVLYGVTLGLLAIGAWTNYTDTQAKVVHEAAILNSLYRGVGGIGEPMRGVLQKDLREYTRKVIEIGWPEQRRGIQPVENDVTLNKFFDDFEQFEPVTQEQRAMQTEIAREADSLEEARSIRLESVKIGLPPPLWVLVLIGGVICIVVTWFFHMESFKMHVWMAAFLSALLGLLVFMVAALDNPYRGKISVGPEAFERVYRHMSKPGVEER